MSKKLTQKQFEEKVNKINPNFEILGEYKNAQCRVRAKCKKCGYEEEFNVQSLMYGKMVCKNCERKGLHTKENIKKMLKEKHPNIEILSDFKNLSSKVLCRCKKCGYEWEAVINNLKRNNGCPCCNDRFNWDTNSFNNFIIKNKKEFEILGEYKGYYEKILTKCKRCGTIWEPTPVGLIHDNYCCPTCTSKIMSEKHTLSYEEFIERMDKIKTIKVIGGKYENAQSIMKFKCLKCGHIWEAKASLISREFNGCPHCNISKGENKIEEFLKENKINFIPQKKFKNCKDIKVLPFDFYLPNYNMCIEFDGKQHFLPTSFKGEHATEKEKWEKLRITKFHDKIKEGFCVFNNIKLIRISYLEFNKIEDILKKELNI